MKRSTKIVVATVAVIGLSVGSMAYVSAGPGWGGCGNGPSESSMHGFAQGMGGGGFFRGNGGDHAERMAQRLDMLKYKLRITEAQEPQWQALEQALTAKMAARQAYRAQAAEGNLPSVTERVSRMRDGARDMAEIAGKIEQLYQVLTPEQQAVADALQPRRMRGMF